MMKGNRTLWMLVPYPIVKYSDGGTPIGSVSFLISTSWSDSNSAAADASVTAIQKTVHLVSDIIIIARDAFCEMERGS